MASRSGGGVVWDYQSRGSDGGAVVIYSIIYHAEDRPDATAQTLGAAVSAVAAAYGRQRSEVGLDDRSSSCGTVEEYRAWLAGCCEHGDPVATIYGDEVQS